MKRMKKERTTRGRKKEERAKRRGAERASVTRGGRTRVRRIGVRGPRLGAAALLAWGVAFSGVHPVAAQAQEDYARRSAGTRMLTLENGATFNLLLEEGNLGSGDVEVAELTLPAGMSPTGGHQHDVLEVFYVVEGVLGHRVNGEEHRIEPGMVGVVKPGDEVVHSVESDGPVRALVIWVPGGEADRVAPPEEWTETGR